MNNLKIKTIPFIVALQTIKFLGVDLTKGVKYFSMENHKTLLKDIKDVLNKWKYISYSWIGRQYCQDGNSPKIDL